MKRYSFSHFAALAILAISSFCTAFVDIGHGIVERTRSAWHTVKSIAFGVVLGPQAMRQTAELVPQARQAAAADFLRKLIKRESPVLSSAWRMCPSI